MTNLAGQPAQTSPSGIFFVTIEPAPIIELSPIVTSGSKIELQPIKQFFPIFIFPKVTKVFLSFSSRNFLKLCSEPSWVINVVLKDIIESSPISTRYGSDANTGHEIGYFTLGKTIKLTFLPIFTPRDLAYSQTSTYPFIKNVKAFSYSAPYNFYKFHKTPANIIAKTTDTTAKTIDNTKAIP